MKTIMRMILFLVLGSIVTGVVSSVVEREFVEPLSQGIYDRAQQGQRAYMLRVALEAEKEFDRANALAWPILAVTVYILEYLWRRRHPEQMTQYLSGFFYWLGIAVTGLIIAVWVNSVYKLTLFFSLPEAYLAQPSTNIQHLNALAEQLVARSNPSVVVWIIALVIVAAIAMDERERNRSRVWTCLIT